LHNETKGPFVSVFENEVTSTSPPLHPTPPSPSLAKERKQSGCDGRLNLVRLLRSSKIWFPNLSQLSLWPFLKRLLADEFTAIWSVYRI